MSIEQDIIPGKILYINVCFPHELRPSDKYFVLVGFNSENRALLLKINTDNRFTETNKNLRERQFRIKSSTYAFLKYDSYLDCGTLWYMIDRNEIIGQLTSDPNRLIGEITDAHKNEVLRLVNISKSISGLHKSIINQSLRAGRI
jgi:hypothetical protein